MNFGLSVIILGVLISIIYYEITGISPGGIIVPGLLVMYINQPERMIYTVIVAVITFLIVKLISRYLIIYGRRRFVVMIVVSIIINILLQLILKGLSLNMLNISIIGYTIAGLIANDCYKQGIKKTIPSLAIVVGIVELLVLLATKIGVL